MKATVARAPHSKDELIVQIEALVELNLLQGPGTVKDPIVSEKARLPQEVPMALLGELHSAVVPHGQGVQAGTPWSGASGEALGTRWQAWQAEARDRSATHSRHARARGRPSEERHPIGPIDNGTDFPSAEARAKGIAVGAGVGDAALIEEVRAIRSPHPNSVSPRNDQVRKTVPLKQLLR